MAVDLRELADFVARDRLGYQPEVESAGTLLAASPSFRGPWPPPGYLKRIGAAYEGVCGAVIEALDELGYDIVRKAVPAVVSAPADADLLEDILS